MVTPRDAADYIAGTGFTLTGEMQLQKLLYYVQAWSLAWDGSPVFDESIEAWTDGPVLRSIRHVDLTSLGHHVPTDLTASQRATVDAVLRHYGNHGGKYLSGVTHGEKPWRQARQGLAADEPGSTPIDPATMMREYSTQAAQGRGPTRRATFTAADHDRADLLHRGARISRQWSRAMALLAR